MENFIILWDEICGVAQEIVADIDEILIECFSEILVDDFFIINFPH